MILNKYFQPYAEYCIRSSFSEEELEKVLKAELSTSKDLFSGIKAYWGMEEKTVFLLCPGKKLKLIPARYGRNTMRGNLFIRCEKAFQSSETLLHITITPEKSGKYLLYALWLFAIFTGSIIIYKVWWTLFFFLLWFIFSFIVLSACRGMGESETQQIRQDFTELLRMLEKKYQKKS